MTPDVLDGTDAHWLMYSDWLEEQGRSSEAEAMRAEVAKNGVPCWHYEWRGGGVGGGIGGVGSSVATDAVGGGGSGDGVGGRGDSGVGGTISGVGGS